MKQEIDYANTAQLIIIVTISRYIYLTFIEYIALYNYDKNVQGQNNVRGYTFVGNISSD